MANVEQHSLKQTLMRHLPALLFFTIIVGVCYFGFLNNAFVSDDIGAIRDNPHVADISYVTQQPFTMLQPFMYVLIAKIGGVHPPLFRFVNIMFHLGSVMLLYGILVLLTDTSVAFFAATLFAIHPLMTESVVWISGGPYNKYVFFLLLSFFAYLQAKIKKSHWWYALSVIGFPLALSASEKCFIYPFILVAYEFALGDIKKNWVRTIPFFAFLGIWSISFVERVQPRIEGLKNSFYQDAGVNNPFIQVPLAITMYLQLLVWPDRLSLYQSELAMNTFIYIVRTFTLVMYGLLTIWAYFKQKFIFFFLTFFLIALIPTLLPFRLSSVVADRYAYFAAIGIFAACAYLLAQAAKNEYLKTWVYVLFSCIVIALMIRTIVRNSDWISEDTLWISAARTSPSSPNNANNLGDMFSRHHDLQRAAEAFQRAIALNPKYADAYHNLGNTYYQMNKLSDAVQSYQTAIALNPNLWQSYRNLSIIFFSLGNFQQSLNYMQQLVKFFPDNSQFRASLGLIYIRLEKLPEARQSFEQSLQLDPNNQTAKQGLAAIASLQK